MLKNATAGGAGRMNQKTRTRQAIIDACRALIQTGGGVTMPDVAQRALVSEATMYRYFPDIASLMTEALAGLWPDPSEVFADIAASASAIERVAFAAEFFLRRILSYRGAVRTMIAATITRPEDAALRPGLRFAWIDYALAPVETSPTGPDATALARLKRDLAVVVSPEALFNLTDLCKLTPEDAVANAVRLATTITAAALQGAEA